MKAPYSEELLDLLTDKENKQEILDELYSLDDDSYLLIKKENKFFKIGSKSIRGGVHEKRESNSFSSQRDLETAGS